MLLLRPVKAKALNQGKAKARVPPTLILQAKAKRAKKAKRARRVKRVQTPKATRAKKDRRVNMPGPSWKVARVQPKLTQNDRFSPSFLPLPPGSCFQFLPPLPIRFTASCLFFPSFSCLLIRFLSPTGLSRSFRPTRSLASPPLFATTQSVIPAHSVYCVFSFSLSCLCATWAQSVIPAHSVPCCLHTCFHLLSTLFSLLFHHGLDSVSHSGSLGLWPSPLPSLLLPSPFLFEYLNLNLFEFRFLVSPKSEPSRSFRPTRFLAASLLVSHSRCFLCHHSPTSSLPL